MSIGDYVRITGKHFENYNKIGVVLELLEYAPGKTLALVKFFVGYPREAYYHVETDIEKIEPEFKPGNKVIWNLTEIPGTVYNVRYIERDENDKGRSLLYTVEYDNPADRPLPEVYFYNAYASELSLSEAENVA